MSMIHSINSKRGYTLVELIVAVGLFAVVMLLASGAYLVMIGINRQVQTISTGIDNLSFALETMTRDIRNGRGYKCNNLNVDCPNGGDSFWFTNKRGEVVSYTLSSSALQKTFATAPSSPIPLTDSSSVTITGLRFYVTGSQRGDGLQPIVFIVVSARIDGKTPQDFTVETSATMRGSDL